jgi:hypothetical protein
MAVFPFTPLDAGLGYCGGRISWLTRQLNSAPEPDVIDHERKRTTEILEPGPAPGAKGVEGHRSRLLKNKVLDYPKYYLICGKILGS